MRSEVVARIAELRRRDEGSPTRFGKFVRARDQRERAAGIAAHRMIR
jgi:hypothetical protein